ncbi:MAG: hypothetical protein Q8903_12760, partial [Bacteroidota bacterium]|nr:hypothetical protein [Bacteroidota bacterium]
ILKISKSKSEVISKLNDDRTNILYAAAYIRIILSLWSKSGFPLNNRPDIVGTLYSAGIFDATGEERPPNNNPKPNNFGMVAKLFYKYGKL